MASLCIATGTVDFFEWLFGGGGSHTPSLQNFSFPDQVPQTVPYGSTATFSADAWCYGCLADIPTIPSGLVDGIAGAGDMLTSIPFTHFSLTVWARSHIPGVTRRTHAAVHIAPVGGWVRAYRWRSALLAVSRPLASPGKGVEFSHWIPARLAAHARFSMAIS